MELQEADEVSLNDLPQLIKWNILLQGGWCRNTSVAFRLVCKEWRQIHDAMVPSLKIPFKKNQKNKNFRISTMFKSLTSLDFSHSIQSIPEEILSAVTNLNHLKQLNFACSSGVTDQTLYSLVPLKSLTSLSVQFCRNVSDDGVKALCAQNEFKTLNLSESQQITDRILTQIRFNSLTALDLSFLRITDFGVKQLARATRLNMLNLNGCWLVTDEGLGYLGRLSSLTCLDLSDCNNITDYGLLALADLKGLLELNLGCCTSITDRGLCNLHSLANLTSIDLTFCRISFVGLKVLSSKRHLKNLILLGCMRVNDEGLPLLSPLTCLTSLNLKRCHRITPDGLKSLFPAARLSDPKFVECELITDEGEYILSSTPSRNSFKLRRSFGEDYHYGQGTGWRAWCTTENLFIFSQTLLGFSAVALAMWQEWQDSIKTEEVMTNST